MVAGDGSTTASTKPNPVTSDHSNSKPNQVIQLNQASELPLNNDTHRLTRPTLVGGAECQFKGKTAGFTSC